MKLDEKLVKDLKESEEIVQIIPLDLLVQAWNKHKNNIKEKLNYAVPIMDLNTVRKLIQEFGFKVQQLRIEKHPNGKSYVIFKGYPGNREIFTGTRYLVDNPKVVQMAVGSKGIVKSAKGGFLITFVIFTTIEVFHYFMGDGATLAEMLGTLTTDFIKIAISSAAGAILGIATGGSVVFGSIAAAPIIVAVGIGVAVGLVLEAIDKNTGATQSLIKFYSRVGIKLNEINYQISNSNLMKHINYLNENPEQLPRLLGHPAIRF